MIKRWKTIRLIDRDRPSGPFNFAALYQALRFFRSVSAFGAKFDQTERQLPHGARCLLQDDSALQVTESSNSRADYFFGIQYMADSDELIRIHFEAVTSLASCEEVEISVIEGSKFNEALNRAIRVP